MLYFSLILIITMFLMFTGSFHLLWSNRANVGEEDWRDKPPALFRMTRPIVNLFVKQVDARMSPVKRSLLQDRLNSAGVSYAITPVEFATTRIVVLLIGILLFTYVYRIINLSTSQIMLVGLVIPLAYFYPDIWLRDAKKARHKMIEKQFPFFLELLVLAMRAGLNFSSSISHSVEKMAPGPVKEEFSKLLRDVKTGMTRKQTLLDLSQRVDLPAVTNFVSVVNQTEELGGELGDVLSAQANQRRKERFLKAEKQANEAPVKMLLPLIGLLFPITLIIIFFPLFIKARESGVFDIL